jgi:hypothetical protein
MNHQSEFASHENRVLLLGPIGVELSLDSCQMFLAWGKESATEDNGAAGRTRCVVEGIATDGTSGTFNAIAASLDVEANLSDVLAGCSDDSTFASGSGQFSEVGINAWIFKVSVS